MSWSSFGGGVQFRETGPLPAPNTVTAPARPAVMPIAGTTRLATDEEFAGMSAAQRFEYARQFRPAPIDESTLRKVSDAEWQGMSAADRLVYARQFDQTPYLDHGRR